MVAIQRLGDVPLCCLSDSRSLQEGLEMEAITQLFYPIIVMFFGLIFMEKIVWSFVILVRFIRRAAGQPE